MTTLTVPLETYERLVGQATELRDASTVLVEELKGRGTTKACCACSSIVLASAEIDDCLQDIEAEDDGEDPNDPPLRSILLRDRLGELARGRPLASLIGRRP